MTAHAIKHNHKPTATPPSTVIANADNHFLPPSEDDDDKYADPANLMGKYDGGGENKGKGGHRLRYRDDDKIEALHGLYEEPKENDDGGNWDDRNSTVRTRFENSFFLMMKYG